MLLNNTELLIIEPFVLNYRARLTGSAIAKTKKLNQKTVSNYLKSLESQNFLKSAEEGRNRLYFLNLNDEQLIVNFISAVENARTINFYQKHILIKEIAAKILPHTRGISLIFGSYAKGNEKEGSDLDIFIAGSADEGQIDKIANVYHLEISIKKYTMLEFKKALKENDPLIKEVINNHILMQNAQEFVGCVRDAEND
ncbi:nucleotidyltransferase domain-containing protein [Candidatus Woesearchaeota archaeon]|nr:nucleotidyltransferase domain-containing protein [Candidatus Woesearchaeota archaeon]